MENEVPWKPCACSGIRSCLLCNPQNYNQQTTSGSLVNWYCPHCGKLFDGDISGNFCDTRDNNSSWCTLHDNEQLSRILLDGVEVHTDFITPEEEKFLADGIDKHEWKMSQSGRRKQDFGPQVNFKRQKVKMGSFEGFPAYSEFLVDRMSAKESLADFHPVELCNLEYAMERGSSIDPHIDDTWIWGEQLVTVNLISNTILTLNKSKTGLCEADAASGTCESCEIQVLMPARSLVILSGEARYLWEHSIKREHVGERRLAMTFRNLSREFLLEEKQQGIIEQLVDVCATFKTIL